MPILQFFSKMVLIEPQEVYGLLKSMYNPKIESEQVGKLYLLRESLAQEGVKKPITTLVKEAIEEYLKKRRGENGQK